MRPISLTWTLILALFILFIIPLTVSAQENTNCPFGYPTNMTTPNGSWDYGQPTDYQSIHTGLDFLNIPGTPVFATGNGEVVWNSTWPPGQGGYGTMVAIKHQCNGRTLYTMYGHLSSINVNVGDYVQAGEKIGEMGNTGAGRSSTGAQVHYEINTCAPTQGWACTSQNHLNPYDYMGKNGTSPQSSTSPGSSNQESGDGKAEVQPETQRVSAHFNLNQPVQQPPQPPSTTSVFNAIRANQKTNPQTWTILVSVVIAGILLTNHKPFGFFITCCLLIWSILLAQPTYAQQRQTYQEYVKYVRVVWQIDVENIEPLPEEVTKPQPQSTHPKKNNSQIAPLFTKEVQYWSNDIVRWANQWGLDPNLVATVMQIESCGDPKASSSAGAMGLFQVMPFHFASGENGYDPETNAKRGMSYLTRSQTAGGSIKMALAGYNAGITGAKGLWSNETERYVYWGTGIYQDALAGKSSSNRLNEWLDSGGASLCRQAASHLKIP